MRRRLILCLSVLLLLSGVIAPSQAALAPQWRFYKAIEDGDLNGVNRLLASGMNPNERFQVNYTDMTALMVAAENGRLPVVEALLAAGAEINAKDHWGMTALMYAAQKGQAPVVKALLAHGAQINAKAKYGDTALSLAEKRGHTDTCRILRQAGAR
jgi:ankyrin repeat protein